MRLGIMGGTFDPIHFGHLVAAEEARVQFKLDRVLFMPTGRPALKSDKQVALPEDRYLMAVIATAANPAFEVSRLEIDRPGLTYTVETLLALRELYPEPTELFFITGADALWDIMAWKDAEKVAGLATFIAATRPGYDLEAATASHAVQAAGFRIEHIEVPALAISSTDIRERFASGRAVRYLTPEAVARYIEKRGLYREGVRL